MYHSSLIRNRTKTLIGSDPHEIILQCLVKQVFGPRCCMGKRLEQTFHKRRYADGQCTHEKMLNITHYQRNANYTMRYHLTLVRMAAIQKSTNNKRWRGCGEQERSCTVGGKVN